MYEMHKKLNATLIIVCSIFLALSFMNGCASKKKVVETPKPAPEVKKPEAPKPAPRPQPKETPRKVEEKVAELRESAFETIYFDFDKSDIRADQRDRMNRNARLLNDNKNVRIRLEGHCDERGTNEYNMALGDRRANSVRQFLVDYGISDSRITTISYGEERPVDPGHNEDAWAKNRRCEFRITPQ